MASSKNKSVLQPYPRREGTYLANDSLFPRPKPLLSEKLALAVRLAFERTLKNKRGISVSPHFPPAELVKMCVKHLQQRSDPIISPSFFSQCSVEEVFELDAVAHEMQRHRMKLGNFYQFLTIELMKQRFSGVFDGKEEGDIEAEIDTPGFERGLRLYISVKKSGDTVGGQDVEGVISRLEKLSKQDKNLNRPFMGVVAVATPPRGLTKDYDDSRSIKCKKDGSPYSPNCEAWYPGFIYPFVCGREAVEVYKEALQQVGTYLPFNSLAHRKECATLLAEELKRLQLVNPATGRIDPQKFLAFISRAKPTEQDEDDK
jgi:hypothetical protein